MTGTGAGPPGLWSRRDGRQGCFYEAKTSLPPFELLAKQLKQDSVFRSGKSPRLAEALRLLPLVAVGAQASDAAAGSADYHTYIMKLFAPQPAPLRDVAPDEPDFPLPVADPSLPPMHRQCVLNGCSYRSRFLFAAGWMLAATFLVTRMALAYLGSSAQEGLLRENALLIEALRHRDGLQSEMPAQLKPSEPAPAASAGIESSEPSRTSSCPTKVNPLPKRSSERTQKLQKYTVPEEEKWWNRP